MKSSDFFRKMTLFFVRSVAESLFKKATLKKKEKSQNVRQHKMCGIAGYSGKKQAGPVIIEILKNLEHRGYDSCGVTFVGIDGLHVIKAIGKINNLEEKLVQHSIDAKTGIGHTRWATHGKVCIENAHPHLDCKKHIAVVHNGIIENFREIKKSLISHKFLSSTDTEVIPHLIEFYLHQGKNNKEAFFLAIRQLKGSFAIATVFSGEEKIYFARMQSNLIIYKSTDEAYLVSDPIGLPWHAATAILVNDKEWGIVSANELRLFNINGEERKPRAFSFQKEPRTTAQHFFLKEILQQPSVMLSSIKNTLSFLESEKNFFKGIEKIVLTGCGSSYHAALIGKYYLETISGTDARAEYPSQLIFHPDITKKNTLFIALSQSGETRDTIAVVEKIRTKTLVITNVEGSLMTRLTPYNIFMGAGPELSVAATKSFTAQILCLYMLSLKIAVEKNLLSFSEMNKLIVDVMRTCCPIEKFLQKKESIKNLADTLASLNDFFILGRGISYPVALEAALKLKEVAYVHAEGLYASEMKHGPLALVSENTPVFFIAPEDKTFEKILNNIEEIESRGGKAIVITDKGCEKISKITENIIYVPSASALSPVSSIIPFQLLSYFLALKKGLPVDRPRNLAKTVTVE
ncbi:MAG: glutamine--fructose-6-phosphate transaminase (isomerizing) [Candidatus Omnitrophica bacterium]|nr:glutamine--fructose-6-phosphate transaminase (isomerizing) [Candidatus Omnitrophota bacterium]